ncbi:small GTP-binding protein [Hortaea werneckii]|nr:small GTP-binding protein [Hortaea werneckii]
MVSCGKQAILNVTGIWDSLCSASSKPETAYFNSCVVHLATDRTRLLWFAFRQMLEVGRWTEVPEGIHPSNSNPTHRRASKLALLRLLQRDEQRSLDSKPTKHQLTTVRNKAGRLTPSNPIMLMECTATYTCSHAALGTSIRGTRGYQKSPRLGINNMRHIVIVFCPYSMNSDAFQRHLYYRCTGSPKITGLDKPPLLHTHCRTRIKGVAFRFSTAALSKRTTTSAAGLHTLTLTDLHSWLVVHGRVTHALLDLAGHRQEGLLDVASVLCRSFEERNAEAVCEFLFSTQLVHTLRRIAVNLLQPLLHVVEAVHVGDIVDDADAMGTAVVGRAYVICISSFTVSYNLQLYCLAIELDRPDFEVHTNGRNVALGIGVVGEPQQQAGLSDARVTDEEELEERSFCWLRHLGGALQRGFSDDMRRCGVEERQYVVRPITSPSVLQVTSRLGSRISLRRPQALASRQESQSRGYTATGRRARCYFGDSNDRPPLEFK